MASITIKQVENIDCGEYRLKLSNDCGDAYADFTVKLLGNNYSVILSIFLYIHLKYKIFQSTK